MLLLSSHSFLLFVTSGSLLLILAQLSLASGSSCPTPPTITLAKYNLITSTTSVSQMQTILGGLGYLESIESVVYPSGNTLTYFYQGANQVPFTGSSGQSTSYASFTFSASTKILTNKSQYGLC